MANIPKLLQETSHRPYPLPDGPWIMYQEWHKLLFAHWRVPVEKLGRLVPKSLPIDKFEGDVWVSLVPFIVKNVRLRFLPPFPPLSDFLEINMRTYVILDNKPGIYFFSLEAQKGLTALLARMYTGLPYMRSETHKEEKGSLLKYSSRNEKRGFHQRSEFIIKDPIRGKTAFDRWLTDRFCLYVDRGKKLYRMDVHHKDWELFEVEVQKFEAAYTYKDIVLTSPPERYQYSPGVEVVVWPQKEVN